MMDTSICIIANLFRIYIVFRFISAFFNEKKSVRNLLPIYGTYYLINTALYLSFHLAWVNIINTLAGVVIIVSFYTKSIKKIIGVSSIIYILNMICDIVATVPFSNYVDAATTSNQILFVFCDFLYLACELIAERILKAQDEGQKIPLVLVPLVSVMILMYMLYSGQVIGIPIVVVSLGLLLINFLVIYLYNELLNSLKKVHENEILNEKINMYNNQINIVSKNEEKVAAIRHDLKNHLSELKIMAMNGKCDEIQTYIDSMALYISNPEEIVKTGNLDMDSLLNYLIKRAKERLNEVDIKINISDVMLDTFDINVIVGNLLDNAIEASGRTEEKILKGFIIAEQGLLKMEFINSYNRLGTEKNDALVNEKNEKHAGIGLKNVQKIVDKYNGAMQVSKGEYFDVKVLMYI